MMKKIGVLLSISMLAALPGCGCWKNWCGKDKREQEERVVKESKRTYKQRAAYDDEK